MLNAQMPMANRQEAGHLAKQSAFGRGVRGVRQTERQLQEPGAVSIDSPMARSDVPGRRQDSVQTVYQQDRYMVNPLMMEVNVRSSGSYVPTKYICEVDVARLQSKMNLLNKRIPKLIRTIGQIAIDRNLTTLSEQIQRCCFNCIYMQDALRMDQLLMFSSSNVNKLEQRMRHYDDQLVECLLSYQPDSQEEQQELFIMCIWYLCLLVNSDRSESANIRVISLKMLALLKDGSIQRIDKERARLRISSLYSTDNSPIGDEQLSWIVFNQITIALLEGLCCHSLDSAKCEKLLAIVEQLLSSDPLFRLEQVAEYFQTKWQQLKTDQVLLIKTIIQNIKRPDFIDSGVFDKCAILHYVTFCIGFWPTALCSPDIALIALQSLYQHRSLSSVRELLVKKQEAVFCSHKMDDLALYALIEFLLHNACEDSVARVKNDDQRYYLKSLICYLDGQMDEAVTQARLSRLPEAFWLLGKIQMDNGAFAEAIISTESAIMRGVKAGKLQLALLLLKSREPDLLKISGLLNDAMEHYGYMGAVKLQSQLAEARDSLELIAEAKAPTNPPSLNDDWLLSDDKSKRSSAVAPRNKNKGKRYKHKRAGSRVGKKEESTTSSGSHKTDRADRADKTDDAANWLAVDVDIAPAVVPERQTRWLSQYDMAILSLSVTQAISCQGYDYAYQLLLAANEKINWDFQRATIARMNLWRLRELANDRQHLQLLSQSVQAGEKAFEFSVIPQDSTLLGQFGLARNERISLTADANVTRDALRNLVIDKALGWLCFLHSEPLAMGDLKRRWWDHPLETAKQQLTDFEHSLSMAFTTASFLSMLGHLHGDIARDRNPADGNEEGKRIRALSAAFYDAANQFNEWRNRLKKDGVLNNRIARATPLGNLQKIRTRQSRAKQEKMENQPGTS